MTGTIRYAMPAPLDAWLFPLAQGRSLPFIFTHSRL